MTRDLKRLRMSLALCAAMCVGLPTSAAIGDSVLIVNTIGSSLPVYDPNTISPVKTIPLSKLKFPIKGSPNRLDMFTAIIDSQEILINPADVMTAEENYEKRYQVNIGALRAAPANRIASAMIQNCR